MADPTPAEIDSALANAAVGPKSMTVGDTTVQGQDIDAIIKARNALAASQAATGSGFGVRMFKIKPPGAG